MRIIFTPHSPWKRALKSKFIHGRNYRAKTKFSGFIPGGLGSRCQRVNPRSSWQPGGRDGRESRVLRTSALPPARGPQVKLAGDFLGEALAPALNRLGISPVGVFDVEIGPESPGLFVLMPSASLETLLTAEFRLNRDAEYLKAGAAFLNAPA